MTQKLLLKAKLLLFLFFASATIALGAPITDFKLTTTSQLIGEEATYTFSYTLPSDNPPKLLQAVFSGSGAVVFNGLSTVKVTIDGKEMGIKPSYSSASRSIGIVLSDDSQKYAVTGAKIEISVDGTNYSRAGTFSWDRIATSTLGGGVRDMVENPPAVMIINPAPAKPVVDPAKYINDSRFSLYWKHVNYGKKIRIEVSENKTFTSLTYSTEVKIGDRHHTIRNLKPATTYYYRVRAFNSTGASEYTAVQSATTQKNKPNITRWPTCQRITYGQPLSASQLSNGEADVEGSFSFVNPLYTPNKIGWNQTEIVFTPKNTNTHSTVSTTRSVFVTRKELIITNASVKNKTYDGTSSASVTGTTLAGVVGTDDVSLSFGFARFANKNAGKNIAVTVTGSAISGTDAMKYFLTDLTGLSANITPKDLTITNFKIEDKTYDGTNQAKVIGGDLSGYIEGDDVNVQIISPPVFSQVTVGSNIPLTADLGLIGTDKNNYKLITPVATANITTKTLTITGATAQNKVYDGTINTNVNGASLSGLISGDNVALSLGSASFANKNVEAGKGVTVTGSTISGADASNYSLTEVSGLTADITRKELTITGAKAQNKVYDGTTNATVNNAALSGLISGDNAELVLGAASFADKNTATDKVVTVTGSTIDGTDAMNYFLTEASALFANITPKDLTITNFKVEDKVYDGTNQANIIGGDLSGYIEGDDVSVQIISPPVFSQVTVGSNIPLTGDFGLTGADKDNYNLIIPAATANISPKKLTIIGATAQNKVYEGTANATVNNAELRGLIDGDNVELVLGAASFADKNAATGKPVTVKGSVINGTDANNYQLTEVTGLTADISTKEIGIAPIALQTKIYGDSDPVFSYSLAPSLITGDTMDGALARENGEDVGNYKFTTGSLTAGSNYQLKIKEESFSIKPKELKIKAPEVTTTKTYDGTTIAQIKTGDLTNVEAGDKVKVMATALYNDANAQTNKKINVSYEISGSASSNYLAPANTIVSGGEIQAKQLSIAGTSVAAIKMLDGTTEAKIKNQGRLLGVLESDMRLIDLVVKADFNEASPGKNKTISIFYSLRGNQAINYIAPKSKKIKGAKVLEELKLAEENGIVVPSIGACENESITIEYNLATGDPLNYKLVFSESAKSNGFKNTGFLPLASSSLNGTINISIPSNCKNGIYEADLIFINEIGFESKAATFAFKKNLSSDFIVPKFNDVVLCDNSSHRFETYQWYKNDEIINGATGQFYNDPEGLSGVYHLTVTTTDGQELKTCPKEINLSSNQASLKVYPNPAASGQDFTVKISNMDEADLQGAVMSIYTVNGSFVTRLNNVGLINKVQLPAGFYFGTVTTKTGKQLTYKININK